MQVEDDLSAADLSTSDTDTTDTADNTDLDDAVLEDADSAELNADDDAASASSQTADQVTQPKLADLRLSDADPSIESLSLADVIASLYQSYPEVIQARQEYLLAGGRQLIANGAYDTKFKSYAYAEPTGFYQNYRTGLGVARQTWWGGQATAGYRIGRGLYQPWYLERQTEDAGEFSVGLTQPLLQGRAIDPERVAFFKARLAQQAPPNIILQTLLEASQDATKLYWQWVSAGNVLEAQRQLLRIAETRGEQYAKGVEAGKFPEIDLILNQQLIAERRAQTLEAEQKFQQVAFKMSIFLRDASGQPMVPIAAWLPKQFPVIATRPDSDFQSDLISALGRRPELKFLQLDLQNLQLDCRLARNQLLPQMDLIASASQDMGAPATSSDDKGQTVLVFGMTTEVPMQLRKARGKVQSINAKVTQTNEKIRLVRNKIAVEIQTANNQLDMSERVVQQTRISLLAALETLKRYRFAFTKGKIDLIYLNLLETKLNETQIKLVKSQENWFVALANLQTAFALDPLEQSITISSLPPSETPDESDLPERKEPEPEPEADQELPEPDEAS